MGQGLNTGIQDAHNLAWKIASVLHEKAPSDVLRTYGPERAAVARRVVRDTDIQTRGWLVKHPTAVMARDAAFRVAERTGLFRLYAPVMAGRRLAYPAARETQLLYRADLLPPPFAAPRRPDRRCGLPAFPFRSRRLRGDPRGTRGVDAGGDLPG